MHVAMQTVSDDEIRRCVEQFLGRPGAAGEKDYSHAREHSFDFAYNYFLEFDHPTEDMQASCMQLGYYLASWGMLRGSSWLFKHTNASHYKGAIEVIEQYNPRMRGIDANRWHEEETVSLLQGCYADLSAALLPGGRRATTLVTKVMLGVWACVPAYDTYFQQTFRHLFAEPKEKSAFNTFSARSLGLLSDFYIEHQTVIDELASTTYTLDFDTLKPTGRTLTRAKIVDMVGFQYTLLPPA